MSDPADAAAVIVAVLSLGGAGLCLAAAIALRARLSFLAQASKQDAEAWFKRRRRGGTTLREQLSHFQLEADQARSLAGRNARNWLGVLAFVAVAALLLPAVLSRLPGGTALDWKIAALSSFSGGWVLLLGLPLVWYRVFVYPQRMIELLTRLLGQPPQVELEPTRFR